MYEYSDLVGLFQKYDVNYGEGDQSELTQEGQQIVFQVVVVCKHSLCVNNLANIFPVVFFFYFYKICRMPAFVHRKLFSFF